MISQFITFQKMIYRKILSCQIVRKWIEKVKKAYDKGARKFIEKYKEGTVMMKIIQQGGVVEASHIGEFYIGMSKKELLRLLNTEYEEDTERNHYIVIETGNAMFWIDRESSKIKQIGVTKGFEGKFRDKIGIGSTLTNVLKYIGNYKEVYDTYELEDIPGICFELEDVDEWDWDGDWEELAAPIEWIFVYALNF